MALVAYIKLQAHVAQPMSASGGKGDIGGCPFLTQSGPRNLPVTRVSFAERSPLGSRRAFCPGHDDEQPRFSRRYKKH